MTIGGVPRPKFVHPLGLRVNSSSGRTYLTAPLVSHTRKCNTPPWSFHFPKLEIRNGTRTVAFASVRSGWNLTSISSLANRVGKYGRFLRAIPAMGASQQGWLEPDLCNRRQM